MNRPPEAIVAPDSEDSAEASSVFLTPSYHKAIDRLRNAFVQERPLAIMTGEGRSAARFVIRRFLDNLGDDVAVIPIPEPCSDAIDFMRQMVHAVGFQPKQMGIADLESIFKMFLCYQKGHNRRTVVCIEEFQESNRWVFDKLRSFVELEQEGNYGLLFIVAGQPALRELLHKRPLESIASLAGSHITLAPFSVSETSEYVRRRVEGAGAKTVDQQFDYDAIPLLHELSEGIPDSVAALTSRCVEIADEVGGVSVSTDIVRHADDMLRVAASGEQADAHAETVTLSGLRPVTGRLIIHLSGEEVRQKALSHGHVLIGRGRLCDIRIGRPTVSRHHALLVYSPEKVTLLDLGSTNGTFVDGYRVEQHELEPGETIAIGDCRIEYIKEDARADRHSGDATQTANLRSLLI